MGRNFEDDHACIHGVVGGDTKMLCETCRFIAERDRRENEYLRQDKVKVDGNDCVDKIIKSTGSPTVRKNHYLTYIGLTLVVVIGVFALYSYGKAKAVSAIPVNGKIDLIITLDKVSLDHNNSVGNEWSFGGSVNSQNVKEGSSVQMTVSNEDSIQLSARAEEHDKYPDIGNSNKTIRVKDLNLANKNSFPLSVTVRENRGRYTGNTAVWVFNYSIKRKVTFSEIASYLF